ncbi:MAG: iron-sulfur cluster assembly accessory protein [Alphaproteobacteria bacterium]|nr:iron-sulfur cluster assembly accessory protein [Alphaproteobacteria bacterium]
MADTANTTERPPIVTLTEAAAARARTILAAAEEPVAGLWIGVGEGGCSGKTYKMDYAREIGPSDEVIEDKGITLVIDPMAMLYLFGTEIDYEDKPLESGFVFRNPNETARCGCGESFSV